MEVDVPARAFADVRAALAALARRSAATSRRAS